MVKVFLIIQIFLSGFMYSQTKVETWEGDLATAKGIRRVEILEKLASATMQVSPEKSIGYGKELVHLADELAVPLKKLKGLYLLASAFYYKTDYSSAIEYYYKTRNLARTLDKIMYIGNAHQGLGLVYFKLGDYQKALGFYIDALKVYEQQNDVQTIATLLNNIGNIHYSTKNYKQALDHYQKALASLKEDIDGYQGFKGILYSNIGNVYLEMGENNKALEFYRNSLKIKQAVGNRVSTAVTLAHISAAHSRLKNHDKALDFSFRALKIFEESKIQDRRAVCLIRIGENYMEKGE